MGMVNKVPSICYVIQRNPERLDVLLPRGVADDVITEEEQATVQTRWAQVLTRWKERAKRCKNIVLTGRLPSGEADIAVDIGGEISTEAEGHTER